ncbi:PREDICTED: zinc finger protein 271-like [Priapulus caudatus]|uniref:Zinc finger protein 271-like n=1 Tax=Priapulus caudatus TaxID=37621 RepID=A0ABM1E9Y9_PRICU|nr:PREDICTED: zinc finger protein 271-like [Priapulus caudatus]
MNMASSVTSSCSVPFLVKQELTSLVMLPAHQSSHLRGQAAPPPSLLLAPESMTTLYYRCISCSECFFTEERFVAHAKAVHCKVLVSQGQDPGQTSAVEPSACNAVSSHMTVVHAETLNPNILSNGTFLQSAAAQQGNLAVKSEASNLDFGIPGPLDSWPWNSAADTANWKKPPNVDYQCDGGMFKTVDKRATEVGGSPAMETDDDDDGLCVLETCGYPYSAAAVATTTTNSEESDIVEALKKLQEEIQPRAATTSTMQRDASDAGGLPIVTAVSGAAQIPAPTTRRRRRGRPSLDQREEEVPAKVEEPAAAAVQPVHSPPWRCKVCNAMFAQSGLLKRHVNQHHSPNKPEYRCGSCDATFRWLGTLRAHQRSHDGRASSEMPYKCDVCAAPFRQLVQLQSHRRVHSDERPWGCATCGATFARETTLYIHRRIHTGEKPHACELCGKTFRQIGTLKTHRRVHTGEKPYQCSVCEKSFAQQGALKAHYRVHSMEKPYQCGTCGRTFSQLSTLNNHERLHAPPPFPAEQPPSTAPAPFPAEQPPPSTAPPGGGGGHPYKCDTCGAVFAMKHVLAVHMRVHTGERPFPCDECGKTFSQRATLNNHRRVHAAAAAAGDQTHACGRCPATFPNAHALSAHHAAGSCGGADGDATSSAASASSAASESKGLHHEPVVPNATAASWNCDTCGAEFAHQSSLSIHRRIHTGEKPYPCDLCGKTFRQKGTMQTHRRIHTGEKPYKCDLCNKAFTQLSPLKTHKKTHIERKL